jgi:hypothetical protein
MIKRLARWILNDEVFTEECAQALCERFCEIESKQHDDRKVMQRHEQLLRTLREDFRILQTRQVNIMNTIEHLKGIK